MGSGVEHWENLPNIIPQREPNDLALSGRISRFYIAGGAGNQISKISFPKLAVPDGSFMVQHIPKCIASLAFSSQSLQTT